MDQNRAATAGTTHVVAMDYWRGIAIISVVLYHFNKVFPLGYLGVDLFFVLSGFLVSRSLLADPNLNGESIRRFCLHRATKILPSYWFFLFFGTLLYSHFYSETHAQKGIHGHLWWKYILFFQNYTSNTNYLFDHIWSLCVEEHFYLILPASLLLTKAVFPGMRAIHLALAGIAMGWCGRLLSLSIGFETFSATHNRIDALCWGVLLATLEPYISKRKGLTFPLLLAGLIAVIIASYVHRIGGNARSLAFHGLVPFIFFLLLCGTFRFRSRLLFPLQQVSKYSYNWYLWHLLPLYAVRDLAGNGTFGLILFIFSGFAMAWLCTTFIEKPGIKLRKWFYPTSTRPCDLSPKLVPEALVFVRRR